MNAEQLKAILSEYPPSMKLVVVVEKKRVLVTTVVEMLIKLMGQPQDASLTFCGRNNCIIRERADKTEHQGELVRCVPGWLEMDMR